MSSQHAEKKRMSDEALLILKLTSLLSYIPCRRFPISAMNTVNVFIVKDIGVINDFHGY